LHIQALYHEKEIRLVVGRAAKGNRKAKPPSWHIYVYRLQGVLWNSHGERLFMSHSNGEKIWFCRPSASYGLLTATSRSGESW